MSNGKKKAEELQADAERVAGASIKTLTPKQELFCQLFAGDREFFGNGVQAYAEAYDIDLRERGAYAGARASASRLLTDANVLARIDELLEVEGLNDQAVDKQLKFVIAQNADFPSKVAAIREYNKLKARIVDKSEQTIVADVTSNGESIAADPLAAGFVEYLKSAAINEPRATPSS